MSAINFSQFNTVSELQAILGGRIRRLRISQNATQTEIAARSGVSMTALRNLETGKGATLATLFRIVRALDALAAFDALLKPAGVDPLLVARRRREPLRASRPRTGSRGR